MLKLNQLTGQYPDLTLCFSLTVQPGERIAILGSSGSGKSTLLNMIAGFLPASHGTLLLNGQDHTTTPPSRRPVSMLFQENNLFSHLTIGQNIALGLHPGLKITATQREHLYALAKKWRYMSCLTDYPASSPAVSDNVLRWRVVWYATSRYCCWMSLFRHSTRHCVRRCWHSLPTFASNSI